MKGAAGRRESIINTFVNGPPNKSVRSPNIVFNGVSESKKDNPKRRAYIRGKEYLSFFGKIRI